MKFSLIKTNLSIIQKVCLAGLFIALTAVLQKVVAVNNIPVAPFVRLSFGGPALIIFSSILLGPLFGGIVGMASDLLGYLVFDIKAFPLFPQITATCVLLGALPYFIFSFVASIKNRKAILGIEIGAFSLIWLAVSLYVILNNQIKMMSSTYTINTTIKVVVPAVSGLIFVGLVLFSIFYKGKESNPLINPINVCFASFICDFFIVVLFGSFMKACAFGFGTFLAIILCQAVTMFLNVMLDTVFISTFLRLTKKYFVENRV